MQESIARNTSFLLRLVMLLAVWPSAFSEALADTISLGAISLSDFDQIQEQSETNDSFAEAIQAFKSNDIARCKAKLIEAREISDNLPLPTVILSRMYKSQGNLGPALALLEQHVVDHPSDPDAYLCFGEIALLSGRPTDAWLHFEHARSVTEKAVLSDSRREFLTSRLTHLRAMTAERRRDYSSAAKLYREVIVNSPNEARVKWKLGQVLVASGEIQSGFETLKREHQDDPALPQPELTVATILVSQDLVDDAEAWYKKGIRAENATVGNVLEFTRWLMREDRLEYASELLLKTPEKWRSHRDLVFMGAVIDRCLGNIKSAESRLASILRDNGNDLEASDQLALVLAESGDEAKLGEAKRISLSNLGRTPKLQRSIATAAWVEFKLGSLESAERKFKSLHQSGVISPQSAFYIGQVLESQEQNQEAKKFYQRSLESKGFFPARRAAREKLEKLAN